MTTKRHQKDILTLEDENSFEFLSGLWTGKKPPFNKAVVIRNTNFSNDGNIDYSNIAVLDVEVKQLQTRKLQKGDIIIERSGGGPKQPVGRVVYFEKETPEIPYSFSNFTSTIRVKENFDSRYVFYFLHNFYAEGNTDHLQRRTTGIRNLDFKSYKKSIIFPPISIREQGVIAKSLMTIQDAIAEQESLITKLKELKQSMMQHLFTQGTKNEVTKMTEVGEVPESWKEVEIGSLGQVVTGSTPSTKIDKYYSPMEVDFISPGDIGYGKYIYSTDKQISKAGFEVSRPIPKDAVCCVCIGSSIGKVAMAYRESTSNQQVNSIICNDNYDNDFVYYLISFYSDMWRGHATFGPVPILSKGSFSKINIPVPVDIIEQKKIAKMLVVIEEKIEIIERKHFIFKDLFKTLLHELMSGERHL